ncbi:MAG: hypothetical protein ABJN26_06770 [Stappiaceae bacterium]
MKLSAPSIGIFLIALVLGGLVFAARYGGFQFPIISGNLFEVLALAYIILLAGTVFKSL